MTKKEEFHEPIIHNSQKVNNNLMAEQEKKNKTSEETFQVIPISEKSPIYRLAYPRRR